MNVIDNPFSVSFGETPANIIGRNLGEETFIKGFRGNPPSNRVCIISGQRGNGKTVEMTAISKEFAKETEWIVIDLNPNRDMLQSLAAELTNNRSLIDIIKTAKIDLSYLGLGISLSGADPITDIAVALDRILETLTKKGKKVLITIDEVVANDNMRVFASQFQIYIRKGRDIFLLMTGLYKNIYELKNDKTLTFLYRAPRIDLKPLNSAMVADGYMNLLGVNEKTAIEMSKIVKGYSFGYQVLGFLCWEQKKTWKEVLLKFDAYMEEYVYEKIWAELSEKDKRVIEAMSEGVQKVSEVREKLNMDSNNFTVYRDRLIRQGIIRAKGQGYIELTLPRFIEFVNRVY